MLRICHYGAFIFISVLATRMHLFEFFGRCIFSVTVRILRTVNSLRIFQTVPKIKIQCGPGDRIIGFQMAAGMEMYAITMDIAAVLVQIEERVLRSFQFDDVFR